MIQDQHFTSVVSAAYGNVLFGSAMLSWKVSGNRKVKCHIDLKMLTWQFWPVVDIASTNSSNVVRGMAFHGCYVMQTYVLFSRFPSLSFPSCLSSDNVLRSMFRSGNPFTTKSWDYAGIKCENIPRECGMGDNPNRTSILAKKW